MKKMISVLPVLFVLFLSTSCQKDPDMSKLDDNFMVYTDYDKKENSASFQRIIFRTVFYLSRTVKRQNIGKMIMR